MPTSSDTRYAIRYKIKNAFRELEVVDINPLNAELNPICHLLALLGGATIVDVSRLGVNFPSNRGSTDFR
jgi:hypothetical protein